jgi:hypothetical protein
MPRLDRRIVGLPTIIDLEWLCAHPDHSMIMIEVEEVFVPMIVDENGQGPVIPTRD